MATIDVYPLADTTSRGIVVFAGHQWPCALGKGGLSDDKREGDGTSPLGCYPLRWLYFRPDRFPSAPLTALETRAIGHNQGWCDAPSDPAYNRPVSLPHPTSHEKLWRDDALYDLILVLGHNDEPPKPGHGSAIFLHIARDGYAPTEGCVALARDHVLSLVALIGPQDRLCIHPIPLPTAMATAERDDT